MLTELSSLIDLQELDKEILEVSQGLASLPAELQDRVQEMEALKAKQALELEKLEELQKKRREAEAEMADLEESIKASRQRLMEIKSNIEYKAMLKEIAYREDQRDQKETRILEFLEQMEAQQQVLAEQQERLAEMEADYRSRAKEVEAQVAQLQGQMAALEKKRVTLRQAVPPPLLKRYEFIRQRKNGSAIAEVRDGVCLGCHLNILPQQYIDLQKGEEILQCPHCQRILYWLGEEETSGVGESAKRAL